MLTLQKDGSVSCSSVFQKTSEEIDGDDQGVKEDHQGAVFKKISCKAYEIACSE